MRCGVFRTELKLLAGLRMLTVLLPASRVRAASVGEACWQRRHLLDPGDSALPRYRSIRRGHLYTDLGNQAATTACMTHVHFVVALLNSVPLVRLQTGRGKPAFLA